MGRWAYGDEIACGKGRCRNLAEWLLLDGQVSRTYHARRTFPVCGLHLDSTVTLLVRYHKKFYDPEIVPLEDPWRAPSRKRQRPHRSDDGGTGTRIRRQRRQTRRVRPRLPVPAQRMRGT